MTLQRTLRPGQQVWNSYGEHLPWSKTLAEWGFIDDASEVCRVYWEAGDILDKDDEHYDARRSVWKKACGQADVDATCIDETGAVAPPLTYLVRVANLSEDELGDKKAAAAKIIARSAESDAPSRLLLRRLISDRLAQHEKLKVGTEVMIWLVAALMSLSPPCVQVLSNRWRGSCGNEKWI